MMMLAMVIGALQATNPILSMPLMEACTDAVVPSCRVTTAIDAETARMRLVDGATEATWIEGEVFHVVARRAAPAVGFCCTIQSAMAPIEGAPDHWSLSTRIEGIDRAVIDFMIIPNAEGGTTVSAPAPEWRGPNAPAAAEAKEPPEAWILKRTIQSEALAEDRILTIYRPPGIGPMPVIYLADGESAETFGARLQPLIEAGRLPPVMIVGLHNGPPSQVEGEDPSMLRHLEYLYGWGGSPEPRFLQHERFLIEEVMPLAESLGASTRKADRIVSGYSNGAAWALAMAGRNPNRFGKVLALSFGWRHGLMRDLLEDSGFGDVYLNAGTLEDGFHQDTAVAAELMRTRADRVRFDSRVAGHSSSMWNDQFPLGVLWLLSPVGEPFQAVETGD